MDEMFLIHKSTLWHAVNDNITVSNTMFALEWFKSINQFWAIRKPVSSDKFYQLKIHMIAIIHKMMVF